MNRKPAPRPTSSEQALLEKVRVMLVTVRPDRRRFRRLLDRHYYLSGIKAVGKQLYDTPAACGWPCSCSVPPPST